MAIPTLRHQPVFGIGALILLALLLCLVTGRAQSLNQAKVLGGQLLKSLNGLTDDVTPEAGEGLILSTAGKKITLAMPGFCLPWCLLGNVGTTPAPQVPQGIEGKSFVPALRDPKLGTKNYIFHVYPRGERLGRAVRTTRYRLVEWKIPGAAGESAEIELYDYETDPLETKNLATAQPEVVSRMRVMLAKLPEARPQIREVKVATKQKQDRTALFEKKDTNHDGKLAREEFLAGQPDPAEAPKRFKRFDANKDGVLSRDEFIYSGNPPSLRPSVTN